MRRRELIGTVTALAALALPAGASAADRDKDRMRDSWEKRHGLNTKINDARRDRDRDGLRNVHEYRAGLNPRDRDTDDDGRRDGREGAGTIKSFDAGTGVLVIDRFRGGELSGRVDATTEIECEDHRRRAPSTPDDGPGDTRGDGTPEDGPRSARHGGDDDRSGSNSGPGGGGDDDRSGSNSGPGRGDDRGDDDERRCGAEELKAGRVVKEAELHTGDDGDPGVFDEVELIVR